MTELEFSFVSIDELVAPEDNVRAEPGDVAELAASMKAQGVMQPLIVRDSDLLVVCGSRRFAAAKEAGMKQVPVIKRPFTEQERVEAMMVENLQREDLTPLEEANGLQRLVELGLTQRQIATRIGRSQAHVSKRLALVALPASAKAAVDSGGITLEDAVQLAKLDEDVVEKVVKKAAKKNAAPTYVTGVQADVQRELEKKGLEGKIAKAERELRKAGEKVIVRIDPGEYGYERLLPEGHAFVKASSYAGRDVVMQPAKHKRMKCHAVAVDRATLEAVEVCTDPERHPSPKDGQEADEAKRQRKIEKARQDWAELTTRRREHVRLLTRTVPAKVAIDFAYLAMLEVVFEPHWANSPDAALACALLELELPDGFDDDDLEAALTEKAKSAADKARVLFALAAAKLEGPLGAEHLSWQPSTIGYFELLGKLEYEPGKVEKQRLKELREDLAEAKAAQTGEWPEGEDELGEEGSVDRSAVEELDEEAA